MAKYIYIYSRIIYIWLSPLQGWGICVLFRCGRGTLLFQATHILTLLSLPRAYAKWTYNLRFMYFGIILSH